MENASLSKSVVKLISHGERTVHYSFYAAVFYIYSIIYLTLICFSFLITLIVTLQYLGYYRPPSWELMVNVFNLVMPIVYSC